MKYCALNSSSVLCPLAMQSHQCQPYGCNKGYINGPKLPKLVKKNEVYGAVIHANGTGISSQVLTFKELLLKIKLSFFFLAQVSKCIKKKDSEGGCGKIFLEHPIYNTDSLTITGT